MVPMSRWRNTVRLAVATSLVGAGLVLSTTPVGAVTFTVDTTADVVNGGDGLTSLREAFVAANANLSNDTIELAPGATYELTDCAEAALTHTAAEALTVVGDAVIEQTCPDVGVIASTDTSATSILTLQELTIHGGVNTGTHLDGAAVFADGRLVIESVTISDIDSGPGGTVVDSSFGGGTVPVMLISDTTITNNAGTAVSGDFISVSVIDSTITDNVGSGVSLVDGTPLLVSGSTIDGNSGRAASTTGQGNTRMQVVDSTLSDNGSGGISCGACASLDVTDTLVTGNGHTASLGVGGGIAFTFDYDPVPTAPGVHVDGSTITDNHARRAGGGISVSTISGAFDPMIQPTIWIEDSTVSQNQSIGDDVPGGGIAVRTGSVILERTEIADNAAGVAGAVASRGGGLFIAETSDDGIVDGRDMIFNDAVVTGNDANGSGGGAFLSLDGRMESENVTFVDNSSDAVGGGLYLATTDAGVDVARFTGNTAARGGGLAANDFGGGGELRFRGATFSANSATEHGGGLTADDLDLLQLTNSTVSGNSAPEGGGLSLGIDPMDDPETVELRFSTVRGNTAPVGSNVVAYEGTLRTEAALIVGGVGGAGCAVGPGSLDPVGHSFTDDAACAGAPTDVLSAADPLLGPLADNGGPTLTHLPADTSPIGGVVPVASCTQAVDQRDGVRPQGPDCEPGSVEVVEVAGPDEIIGTAGPDVLIGTPGDDLIRGLGDGDVLTGLGGDDLLEGGDGSDLLRGGPGRDVLRGGPGVDLLIGTPGDVLDGGPGPDLCWYPRRWLPRDC